MKKILIFAMLLVGALVYFFVKPTGEQTTFYNKNESEKVEVKKIETPIQTQASSPKIPEPNSGNKSPETGWSAFPGVLKPQAAPDVNAQISAGNGSPELQTISAKKGQRVSILFTANIRDLVKIEGYNIETYIESRRDSTIGFNADKKGIFPITLVKLNKTVGTLNIE